MLLETLVHYIPATYATLPASDIITKSIIWMHGLGADNRNFLDLIPYLKIDLPYVTKIIFPQAPNKVVTANGHMKMPAWYDIRGWDFNANMIAADFEGMQVSITQIHDLIKEELAQGVLAKDILVGGFSQGGVMGLLSALTYPDALAGAFGLSCYLPKLENFQIPMPLKTPQIFMAHGEQDTVVPHFVGKLAKKRLISEFGANLEWHSYAIEHTINLEESHVLGSWMNTQLR
jgi:phospholipase/carboxylesterase